MCNIPTINEFSKSIDVFKSLHTGKEQIANMSFIQENIDMINIDYSNSNQKIHFINPQYGAEMIYLYNNFKEYHSHNTIMNIFSASTADVFYFRTLKNQFGFKNVYNIAFAEMDCATETYDIVIRCTPGDTFDFVKGFEVLKPNGKILYSHLAEILVNKKERTMSESEERVQFKDIISSFESKIRFFNGTTQFKSIFDTPVANIIVTKKKSNSINILYNHIDINNNNWNVVKSINDIWIHGNPIVSNIFKYLNNKTKKYPKIFNRLYKNLKKQNKNTLDIYKYWVTPNYWNGVLFSRNYYSFFSEQKLKSINTKIIYKSENLSNLDFSFGFKTKKEALNFVYLLETKFMRFYLSMYKVDKNLNRNETRNLPEFDLSKKWTDKMIQKKLEIPKKYCTFIDEFNFIQ
jgi:hypothetical protein